LALIVASSSFLSCQKEIVPEPVSKQVENQYDNLSFRKDANSNLEDVAIMLAKALKDKEVGKIIKLEASKQFDGDYDILYNTIAEHSFIDGEKFKAKLAKFGSSENGRTSVQAAAHLKSISESFPILNIAIPVNAEKWDPEHYTPLVAFRPVDYDEATAKTVKAFDSDGKVHLLDAKKEPTVPVIVVCLNERVDSQGKILKNMIHVDKTKNARVALDSRGPWNRDAINYPVYPETLHTAGFKSRDQLRKYEDWVSGNVELQLDIIKLNKTVSDSSPFGGSPSDWDHEHVVNITIFTWDYNVNGDRVEYHWTEMDDAGQSLTFKIGLSGKILGIDVTTEATLSIDSNDDVIGHRTILFTDGIPGGYDVGQAFYFQTVQF